MDVGGTKTLSAVVTPEGSVEARVERPTVTSSQEALLAELDSAVEELRSAHPGIAAIGFGIPSRIDQGTGRAIASVNIPLADLDFRGRMRERHGLPVAIDNDGNAAAIAEWKTGAAQGASYVVMLTLGTGVGGGLILDGRPYRGATGSGAELGHIVVDLDGPLCGCGGRGHLESVASGKAASLVAQELYGADADAHELVRRAEAGEGEAVEAMAVIGRHLGAGSRDLRQHVRAGGNRDRRGLRQGERAVARGRPARFSRATASCRDGTASRSSWQSSGPTPA